MQASHVARVLREHGLNMAGGVSSRCSHPWGHCQIKLGACMEGSLHKQVGNRSWGLGNRSRGEA